MPAFEPDSLSELFDYCANKEVRVRKLEGVVRGAQFAPVDNDPVMDIINKFAAARGYTVRVWVPGTLGRGDLSSTRLNVTLRQSGAAWRIAKMDMG